MVTQHLSSMKATKVPRQRHRSPGCPSGMLLDVVGQLDRNSFMEAACAPRGRCRSPLCVFWEATGSCELPGRQNLRKLPRQLVEDVDHLCILPESP